MIQTIQLKQFKYSGVPNPDDITGITLSRTLFGLNGRIYANLASYGLEKGSADYKAYAKHFTEQELRYGLINRLFQVHISVREYDAEEEWTTHEKMDFKDVYEFVKKNAKKIKDDAISIHASYHDSGNATDKELGVLYIPLGAEVLRNAANYAYQEIEKIKMDNFMNTFADSEHVNNFLNIF